ncbi:MAG: MFS transporter [Planctomycetales bacterium]|nr:MFS transporter [Planctomycetales bacterium]
MTRAWLRYRAAYAGLPREVWLMAVVLFVNRAGAMVLPFLTLYLTSEMDMPEASATRLISVFGLGAVVGSYLGGRLAARFGAIRVQTLGMLLSAPACLLIPLGRSWEAIAASLFVWSVASAAVRPANAATIAKLTTHETRMRAFALQRLAANFGFSFGPAIGGVLASWKFTAVFVVDACSSLTAFAALAWFFRFRRLENPAVDESDAPAPKSPLRDREYMVFLALMLAGTCVFFQLGSTYPLYLRDHFGFSKPRIGLMFAVNTSVIVLVEMLLVDMVQGLPLVRTVGWGLFLSCLGFGMLPLGSAPGYAVFAMLVVTVGEMLSLPLSAGYVANRSPPGSESAYMGYYSLMLSLAWMIGPSVGGLAYQWNRDALWYGGAAVGLAVLAGFELLAARMRRCDRLRASPASPEPELFPDAAYPAAIELEEAV